MRVDFKASCFASFGAGFMPDVVVPTGKAGYGYEDAAWFLGRSRDSLAYADVDSHYCIMPFFSHEAYRYYLPVFMCFGLQHGDRVLDFTVYGLSISQSMSPELTEFHEQRLRLFSVAEKALVVEFLEEVGTDPVRGLELALEQIPRWST